MEAKTCPTCNQGHLYEVTEENEMPDGSILGYVFLKCSSCEAWFDPEEIYEEDVHVD